MQASVQRRAVRRAVPTQCQAVALAEFQLLGERVVDLSPVGMLVRCVRTPRVGDDVVVSFKAPGLDDGLWLDAEAVVARLIRGFRSSDRGICVGLRFTYFEKTARNELLARLAGFPPPVPQRRLQTARERTNPSLPRPTHGLGGRVLGNSPSAADLSPVWIQRVVTLSSEPVFPLLRRRRAPRGAFFDSKLPG